MKFEIGKYYRHTTGHLLSILGEIETDMWGKTLVAESNRPRAMTELTPVGSDAGAAVNYSEIDREQWMQSYS